MVVGAVAMPGMEVMVMINALKCFNNTCTKHMSDTFQRPH